MHGIKSKFLLGIGFDLEHEEKVLENRVLRSK